MQTEQKVAVSIFYTRRPGGYIDGWMDGNMRSHSQFFASPYCSVYGNAFSANLHFFPLQGRAL